MNSENPSWPWVVLRNILTLCFCVVGGALLWPARVGGWPLATIVWIGVVIAIQVLLIGSQNQPWLGLNYLTRANLSRAGVDVHKPGSWSIYPRYLMILDDVLPLLIFGWALYASVTHRTGLVHHVLMGCLLALIACSLPVKSRLGRDMDGGDHRKSESNS